MWSVKTKLMAVIIEANGTIRKSSREFLSNIPGRNKVKEPQNMAILGTSHILQEVLV
jgi:hypothetical protein